MRKRSSPAVSDRATSRLNTTTGSHHSAGTVDSSRCADNQIDLALLGGPAADIWAKLFNGEFKLAVPCSRCGRWLTSGASKRHRMGAKCRAKSTAAAVAE